MKLLKTNLLFFCLLIFGSYAGAQTLNTQFEGWIGKNQQGFFLDTSEWHYCFNSAGGNCGSVALTTGASTCHSQGFDIGGAWSPPKIIGLGIAGDYNRSWTACNSRSETISCSPNVGYKGRATVNFSQRWGTERVLGASNYLTSRASCPAGFRLDWLGGPSWRCTYVGGSYTKDGYLPEWRGSSCDYQKI